MNQFHFLSLVLFIIPSVLSKCNSYYQSSGPSSTKRPFDICYHSEIDDDAKASSYRYYCTPSTPEEYGNNSVGGYTAFREDFNEIDCNGIANQTRIVKEPYRIFCASTADRECEILRLRQYPIVNMSSCTYNTSIYGEDIEVIAMCDDNGEDSEAVFCNKKSSNNGDGSYFWTNKYYNGECESNRMFEAAYQFHGCQGDGETYLQIMECDFNYVGETKDVKPFDDGMFLAGFVLLLIAICCIIGILVWYCCWFRMGFNATLDRGSGHHVAARSTGFDDDDEDDDGAQTRTMR